MGDFPDRLAKRRKALVDHHTPLLAKRLLSRYPAPADLLDGWQQRQSAAKNAKVSGPAAEYLAEAENDETADDEMADVLTDGFHAGWEETVDSASWDYDTSPPETGKGSRLVQLIKDHPVLASIAAARLVDGLISVLSSNPTVQAVQEAGRIAAVTTVNVDITASLSAGVMGASERIGVANVRLVVSGGECAFCQEYDGRIMPLDAESGVPPLHRGCACCIEPLTD